MTKVHYQKHRSREIATKAHACLQKLHGEKGTELNTNVRTRLSHSPIVSPQQDHLDDSLSELSSKNTRGDTKSNQNEPCTNSQYKHDVAKPKKSTKTKRKKALLFTIEEDNFLSAGIKRHGFGQWSAILKDPQYKFQEGRTANSLLSRALRRYPMTSNN